MEEKKVISIPKEKFEFANQGEKLSDKKFDTKPIGYFKDAFIRFCKNKASVVAAIIIGLIIVYAFVVPWISSKDASTLLDIYYQKNAPRNVYLKEKFNIFNGGKSYTYNEQLYVFEIAKGVAAEDKDGTTVTLQEGLDSYYSPINKLSKVYETAQGRNKVLSYDVSVDVYLSVGFVFKDLSEEEFNSIRAWENETGKKILYPMIAYNEYFYNYNPNFNEQANMYGLIGGANYWYKTTKVGNKPLVPVTTTGGEVNPAIDLSKSIAEQGNVVLEDNYARDDDGNLIYYIENLGQYKVRMLYYNYYIYNNNHEPNYILGTDSQGYDLAVRMANGIKLSLLLAVTVSAINFIIGAMYGAVSGYYGGVVDLTLERITDILAGIPFIIVATLFQMHLAKKVGAVPCLIFAFILTGWIGTASRVRTQFYRFKNQEYVMAARTLGAKDRRIIWKHIFPNTLGTIITSSVLVIPGVIFSESMLSFLGIVKLGGAKTTSLGTMLSEASSIWTKYPHLMAAPAVIISLLMICFNLFGNGLRDAFNPTLRGVEE